MTEAKISLQTIDDVKEFVSIVLGVEYAVDLVSGKYVVDAKSIMGIFSLDLSKPLVLRIYSEDCSELLDDIKKFVI